MDDSEDETDLPISDDLIPKQAIRLTDAYELLAALFDNHPDRIPEFDEDSSKALRRSRQTELTVGHDPAVFDAELEEQWHFRKQANLFLRQAIEAEKIIACVRDPINGDVLQFPAEGWIPESWKDDIPPGIWTNFIYGDFESPGPAGSMLSGSLRPVFFIRSEFERWLETVFGEAYAAPRFQDGEPEIKGTRIPAVIEAVRALWGKRPPAGMPVDEIHDQISSWLQKEKRIKSVGRSTVYRALKFNDSLTEIDRS